MPSPRRLGGRRLLLASHTGSERRGDSIPSDPSDNFLDGSFLTGCWTNDAMAGNPANAPSVRSTWLSRQLTIPLVVVLFLTIVRGLFYLGCPRSCLMELSDRGHPSVSSSGPTVPIVIKKRAGGCLRHAFPEAPPPLTRMKKNQKEEEGDDTNSNVSVGPPDPRPPDGRVGPPTLLHRKLRQMIPWIPFLVPRLRRR